MGCNSDYMNPTGKEKRLQETAQLLMYVGEKLSIEMPKYVHEDAANIYAKHDESVPLLCKILTELPDDKRDDLIYNSKDKTARKLADWWDEHQAADNARIAKEQRAIEVDQLVESALSKLTPEEKTAIAEKFRISY